MVSSTECPPAPAQASGTMRGRPSLGGLFSDLVEQGRTLMRQEICLARAEVSEKARELSCHVSSIAIGAGVALVGAIALAGAASAGLGAGLVANGIPPLMAVWLAPLVVGVVIALIGYAMIHRGVAMLRQTTVVPERTAESLKETGRWMQDKVS